MAYRSIHRQQGLSLVELMVGMAIGLVLLLGISEVFLGNSATFRTQEGIARTQESGRFAIQKIASSVRSAGFFGCGGLKSVPPNVIASSPPSGLTTITTDTPITGQNNVASGTTIGSMALVVGTDTITLRGSGADGVSLTGSAVTSQQSDIPVSSAYNTLLEGDYVLITDCATADLFRATENTTSSVVKHAITSGEVTFNNSATLTKQLGADTIIVKPYIETFFVADSGRDNYQGDNVISLYMQDLTGTVSELVEGISNLQVLYGVDVDDDGEAERYMDAGQITTASNWNGVVSARISLLVDSIESALQTPSSYTFQGTTTTPTDKLLRKEFTGLFVLRNRTP
ncbi:MAG: PilW family protein [Sedimenticola sp.]